MLVLLEYPAWPTPFPAVTSFCSPGLWRSRSLFEWLLVSRRASGASVLCCQAPTGSSLSFLLGASSLPPWGGYCFIPEYFDCRDPFLTLVNQSLMLSGFFSCFLAKFLLGTWHGFWKFFQLAGLFCFCFTPYWIISSYFIVHLCYFFPNFQISDLHGNTDPVMQATTR